LVVLLWSLRKLCGSADTAPDYRQVPVPGNVGCRASFLWRVELSALADFPADQCKRIRGPAFSAPGFSAFWGCCYTLTGGLIRFASSASQSPRWIRVARSNCIVRTCNRPSRSMAFSVRGSMPITAAASVTLSHSDGLLLGELYGIGSSRNAV